jgi:hypothetical protein
MRLTAMMWVELSAEDIELAAARVWLRAGLTLRDVAALLRAHPRAIEALLA